MILFFDTETTGLYNARIVELAALLTDENGNRLSSFSALIDHHEPIPEEATAIHGITTEMCSNGGIPLTVALDMFLALHDRCNLLVAHNLSFDLRMVTAARVFTPVKTYCTMMNSVRVCGLKNKNGASKWPRLSEAYQIICGKELIGSHRAMADTLACSSIFFKLNQKGE